MDLSEYQSRARATAVYPQAGDNLLYPTLGLCGEAGEVAEKIKKMVRDDDGVLTDERARGARQGAGRRALVPGPDRHGGRPRARAIAAANIEKLSSRQRRNVLQGSGDDR